MKKGKDERLMFLLDSFLEGTEDCSMDSPIPETIPMDYVSAYLASSSDSESGSDKLICSKTEQLLNAFLSTDHEKAVPNYTVMTSGSSVRDEMNIDVEDDDTEQLDDSYFTETLARIYLKQHRYDKSLEIIRSLYLNFPNKSIYFADQIRYLEKLVRINQKNR